MAKTKAGAAAGGMRLADVAIVVSDAKKAAQWWQEKIGFEVTRLMGSEHGVMIAPPGETYVLHLCEGEPVEPGNTGIGFMAADVMALAAELSAKGVAFPEPATRTEWGAMAKFADPDGNVYWLMEAPEEVVQQARRAPKKAARKAPARKPSKAASKKSAAKAPRKGAAKKPASKKAPAKKGASKGARRR